MALNPLSQMLVSDPVAGLTTYGALTLSGAKAGDIILAVANSTAGSEDGKIGSFVNLFFGSVTVDDEVYQSQDVDLSGYSLTFVILRP